MASKFPLNVNFASAKTDFSFLQELKLNRITIAKKKAVFFLKRNVITLERQS